MGDMIGFIKYFSLSFAFFIFLSLPVGNKRIFDWMSYYLKPVTSAIIPEVQKSGTRVKEHVHHHLEKYAKDHINEDDQKALNGLIDHLHSKDKK